MNKSPWDDDNDNVENIFSNKKNKRKNLGDFKLPEFSPIDPKNMVYIFLGVFFLYILTGFYKVNEGEQAAILRFGKFVRIAHPGLNYHLPAPFETALIEPVNKSRRVEIGYRSTKYSVNNTDPLSQESLMLTGDENIINLNCDAMWHIKNLEDYLFNIANPVNAVKNAAESAIREVIGETPIASALSNEKQQIAEKIEVLLQNTLDNYKSGIQIEIVNLLRAEPPMEVIDAYRDVQTSRADKEKTINEALAYNNDVLPKARGESSKIVQTAEGYKEEKISKSKGDTERFLTIYDQYVKQKQLTRDRLYLETAEKVLKNVDKVIVGTKALPHLALDKIK